MHIDSKLQKIEFNVVAAVAAGLVTGGVFLLAELLSAHDYSMSQASATTQQSARSSVASPHESPPALLEPALRSLDGVIQHG
ncbi:MAG TPA: hypothetical protein VM937_01695 [Burkholderiaceae bacterium]|jgi:hypothetical protein|nr:hypothetical protein [Burkholderiaceae bacterium]